LVTSILSGLGAGLQKDDYDDFKEGFLFKRKEEHTKEVNNFLDDLLRVMLIVNVTSGRLLI
jgi:hypothetical protein